MIEALERWDQRVSTGQLGRSYFPQTGSAGLSAESKDELITDIRADLAAARAAMTPTRAVSGS